MKNKEAPPGNKGMHECRVLKFQWERERLSEEILSGKGDKGKEIEKYKRTSREIE